MSEDKEQRQNMPGTIGWNEIVTPDKAGTVDFYSKLMGWTTMDMDIPGGKTYTMFQQGDQMVGGCIQPAESHVPPMWLSYILVEDLDATTAKAKELGATVLVDRMDVPMGSFVVIADPQGAAIAFWQGNGQSC